MTHRVHLFVALAVPLAVGCQWSDHSPSAEGRTGDELQPPAAATDHQETPVAVVDAAIGAATTLAVAEDPLPSSVDVPQRKLFEPPFPHRRNLFQRPAVSSVPQLVRQSDQREVHFKGIINVDEIRALLEVDGRISAVPVGGSVGDIRVETISPTGVTLRKGPTRWQVVLSTDDVE